ncbi:MAG TPA: hypothetical protein VMV54_09020, partial [Acidocella sp.]|nr:hypothetical protein [Acidocella sp.]
LAGCATMPAQTAATAPALPLNAQGLVGATPAMLNAEFGQPALLRVDGPAQVWLYRSAVCGLNLILYTDHAGVPRVADAVPDAGDPSRCMASLQRSVTDAANGRAMERQASS